MKFLCVIFLILLAILPSVVPQTPSTCGNGVCDPGETPANCPQDCGLCGDGICEWWQFEDRHYCPQDCTIFLETFVFGNDYVTWLPSSAVGTLVNDYNDYGSIGGTDLQVLFPDRTGNSITGYFNIYDNDWALITDPFYRMGFFYYELQIDQTAVADATYPDFIIYSESMNSYIYYYFDLTDYATLSDGLWNSIVLLLDPTQWYFVNGTSGGFVDFTSGTTSTDAQWNAMNGSVSAIYLKGQFSDVGSTAYLGEFQLANTGVWAACNCCQPNTCDIGSAYAVGATTGSTGGVQTSASTGSTGVHTTGSTGVFTTASTGSTGVFTTGSTGVFTTASTGSTGVFTSATTGTTGSTGVHSTGSTGVFTTASTGSTGVHSTGSTGVFTTASTGSTGVHSTGSTGVFTTASTGSTGVHSTGSTGVFTTASTGSTGVHSTGSTGVFTTASTGSTGVHSTGSTGIFSTGTTGRQTTGSTGSTGTTGFSCNGNGICDQPYENQINCPEDCGICGDGICETQYENPSNCPQDCGYCGNGVCQPDMGENSVSCPQDCGPPICGNGVCQAGESPQTCPADCSLPSNVQITLNFAGLIPTTDCCSCCGK